LAGWVSAGVSGADAQGPWDAGTTDEPPTQPVHGETTRWQSLEAAAAAAGISVLAHSHVGAASWNRISQIATTSPPHPLCASFLKIQGLDHRTAASPSHAGAVHLVSPFSSDEIARGSRWEVTQACGD